MTTHRRDGSPGRQIAECTALEYILLGDLRDLLEDPPDDETCQWLLTVLDALLETLPQEFALKEQSGYLTEVLDEYPSWYRHVEELRNEHQTLYVKLRQLRDQIARQVPFAEMADQVRLELRDWMTSFIAHHRHETRLLQTAINLEVGVGD